ncbi:MAG: amidohydrolase [Acidobacteria bacterium]|nr:MAG: amidohydrolase [Acidobacteriota bacterium]
MSARRVRRLLAAMSALAVAGGAGAVAQAPRPLAIRGARIVTVSGPVIESGTIVLAGGRIAAVGAQVTVPVDAEVIDGQVRAWIAVQPHSDLIPVARANGVTAALTAPLGGLVSGQSALIRLAGSTPDALTVKQPVAMHMVYPTGRPPFEISRLFEEPELKTFEERVKDRKQNQEKELRRLGNLIEDARAYGQALKAAGTVPARDVDLAEEALAPVSRGEMPVVMRADAEDDIRGAVRFAGEHGLKLIVAGGLEAWRCADLLKQKDVAVLVNVDRLPRRESDRYDAAYANPAALQRAGVRFAIVSDDASQVRNLPYEAAMARAFGLPAEIALRAITLSPAEIFGVADRLGSLEVGKEASVFVATGDIMDHRTQVTQVFVAGVPQSLETRHTRLWREFKDRQ